MNKKFTHEDCRGCRFAGHFLGHDVYVCNNSGDLPGGSVIARYGNEGWEYASQPIKILLDSIKGDGRIGGSEVNGNGWSMPYCEWLFSEKSIPSTSAMILGLVVHGMEEKKHLEVLDRKVSHGCADASCIDCDY